MSEAEIIDRERRATVRTVLEELGYKPRYTKKYISQNEAIKLLKPVKIGRAKLNRLINDGIVRANKENFDVRNSVVRINREDVYKLLNG